ncbi:type IV secretion system protein [Achromobacter kerstersii]|uniref:type IV secretion system protein n=1 Tax=Achromobacter kerstersii TaxID=1353890 RepID=UPI0006C3B12A|nr:type IV secretion system protein [Achromobacter kerstersii]CUJ49759.1 P-type DNA transfer protein VirB5 [Achromobacter kerstersii]
MSNLRLTFRSSAWRTRGAALVAIVFLANSMAPAHSGGVPTFDGASIAQRAIEHSEGMAKAVEQISLLTQQLESQRRQLESLTGTRNLGDILSNPAIRDALPDDVRSILGGSKTNSEDLIRKTEQIVKEERLTGNNVQDRRALDKRADTLAVKTKAFLDSAQAGSNARVKQIDQLQAQINKTTDPKAISDLQARLLVEQANILADQMRADLLTRQLDAERTLMEQQAEKIAAQSFSIGAIRAPLPSAR